MCRESGKQLKLMQSTGGLNKWIKWLKDNLTPVCRRYVLLFLVAILNFKWGSFGRGLEPRIFRDLGRPGKFVNSRSSRRFSGSRPHTNGVHNLKYIIYLHRMSLLESRDPYRNRNIRYHRENRFCCPGMEVGRSPIQKQRNWYFYKVELPDCIRK